MSWGDYLPDPPEPEEPTDDEYCAMSGHEPYWEDQYELGIRCYCGMVFHRGQDDPHDEYSAYHADLIDLYVNELREADYRIPYDLRFEMGRTLRNKSIEYLLSLIASAKSSGPKTVEGWAQLDEDTMDFFEKLGLHLTYSGLSVISPLIFRLGERPDYGTGNKIGKLDPFGVLDQGSNLEVIQRAARLYVNLAPVGHGLYWQHKADKAITSLLPVIEKRPDLNDSIAAILNREGYSPATMERVFAMAEDEAVAATLVEGFL